MPYPLPLQGLYGRVRVPYVAIVEFFHVEFQATVDTTIFVVNGYFLDAFISLGIEAVQVFLAVCSPALYTENRRTMMLQSLNLLTREWEIDLA
jgi:hypothetical protein